MFFMSLFRIIFNREIPSLPFILALGIPLLPLVITYGVIYLLRFTKKISPKFIEVHRAHSSRGISKKRKFLIALVLAVSYTIYKMLDFLIFH